MIKISTALSKALLATELFMTTGEDQTTFEPFLLHHEGGTKFYEVITFNNPDLGLHFVVQRWGSMAHVRKGGAIKVHSTPSARAALSYAEKTIKSKQSRGYSQVSSTHQLHGIKRNFDSLASFHAALATHYTPTQLGEINLAIKHKHKVAGFGIDRVWVDEAGDVIVAAPPSAPAPEIQRDDNWGSW